MKSIEFPRENVTRKPRRIGFRRGYTRALAEAIRAVEGGMGPSELRRWYRVVRRWRDFQASPPTPPAPWCSANFEVRRRETLRTLSGIQRRRA